MLSLRLCLNKDQRVKTRANFVIGMTLPKLTAGSQIFVPSLSLWVGEDQEQH